MKYQHQLLLLGLVLFISIIISLSNVGPVPYSNNNIFSRQYRYREGIDDEMTAEEVMPTPSAEEVMPEEKKKKEAIKAEGFQGLQSAAYGQETPIDLFSHLPSGGKCGSSPYSNSQGYLCLDQNAKNMLATRGGNQTGCGSQIGSPV